MQCFKWVAGAVLLTNNNYQLWALILAKTTDAGQCGALGRIYNADRAFCSK